MAPAKNNSNELNNSIAKRTTTANYVQEKREPKEFVFFEDNDARGFVEEKPECLYRFGNNFYDRQGDFAEILSK